MFPKGFFAKGVSAGIKKDKTKKDMAIFYSAEQCIACGMFTANQFRAAPVTVSMNNLKNGSGSANVVLVNSGCANACTGFKGIEDAMFLCSAVAAQFGVNPENVLVASTGVIGNFLPMEKILKGSEMLYGAALNGRCDEVSAAQAIMTTDTKMKIASRKIFLPSQVTGHRSPVPVTIWGCTKGAGMIHPELKKPSQLHATMLSFILTDAAIDKTALQAALSEAVEGSFNCISVDGDTSTNDTVLVLANGKSGAAKIKSKSPAYKSFSKALSEVCLELAKMMAMDGEGATKLIKIEIKNALSKEGAKKIAATIATSPLVKTAVFGNDANWGRILAAAGRSGVKINTSRSDVYINSVLVAKNGMAIKFSESAAKKALAKNEVRLTLDLKMGKENINFYTCDLTFDYIKENASYRS